jgi:putative ABC transport system permease protein
MRLLSQIWEGFQIAFVAIRNNKMRSLLTTLGIIIGIVMVTSMFTVINGMERAFDKSVSFLGNDVVHVGKWQWGNRQTDWWNFINRPNMQYKYGQMIRERSKYAIAVAPLMGYAGNVKYHDKQVSGAFLRASTPEFAIVTDVQLDAGRFYTEEENRSARNVCIVGADVVEALFPNERPLGKTIRVSGQQFEVIGILGKQGKFLGLVSLDNQLQMPYNTMKKNFGEFEGNLDIQVKVPTGKTDEAIEELTGIMRTIRKLEPTVKDNFALNRQEAFREAFDGIKAVIYGVGIFLTALSLIVGGIGVMNIMFVSVKERTKEIGIRKAIGAPRRAILTQFLIEAVAICIFGGLVGIALSFGVAAIINTFFTAVMSVSTVVLAFSICVGVGVIFGFVPAWSASRANPIEALRYE